MKLTDLFFLMFSIIALIQDAKAINRNIPSLVANKNALIEAQYQKSIQLLFHNLSPYDGLKGAIVASPSNGNPNYYFNWVRDAALTTESLIAVYNATTSRNTYLRSSIKSFLLDFINFNVQIQKDSLLHAGLGEPRFLVDGRTDTLPWGRPQNDGPALRSAVNIEILFLASKENWPEFEPLLKKLYDPNTNNVSLVKSDLEYVAHYWMNPTIDLWEEFYGYHFYTLMTQRKSLYYGAALANVLKDTESSNFYLNELKKAENRLQSFWNPNINYILASFYANQSPFVESSAKKKSRVVNKSQLDIAVLLGVLHAEVNQLSFSISDPRVFSSYLTLKRMFSQIYSINNESSLNTAFGRYPEDTYDGYSPNSRGNPWILTTAAAAEYNYRLALDYLNNQKILINFANVNYFSSVVKFQLIEGQTISVSQPEFKLIINSLINEGDLYMLRILYHANPDGSLSEQYNRENGYMQGAPHLTWSYAAYITAKIKRDQVIARVSNRKNL